MLLSHHILSSQGPNRLRLRQDFVDASCLALLYGRNEIRNTTTIKGMLTQHSLHQYPPKRTPPTPRNLSSFPLDLNPKAVRHLDCNQDIFKLWRRESQHGSHHNLNSAVSHQVNLWSTCSKATQNSAAIECNMTAF